MDKTKALANLKALTNLLRAAKAEMPTDLNIGILSMQPPKVEFTWGMADFVEDLATVLELPPMTEEELLDAKADLLLVRFDLK